MKNEQRQFFFSRKDHGGIDEMILKQELELANANMKDEKKSKPIHVKPSFYAYCFEPLKQIALKHGYNLVLHGSLNRDMDLIAIPWSEVLGDKRNMIEEMCEYVGGSIMDVSDADREHFMQTHHGRDYYVINVYRAPERYYMTGDGKIDPVYYLDISVTPAIG